MKPRNFSFCRTPETALISKEERDAHEEQRNSTCFKNLNAALDECVEQYGAGDAAGWAAKQARRLYRVAEEIEAAARLDSAERKYVALVRPSGERPILRLPSADALFDAGAGG